MATKKENDVLEIVAPRWKVIEVSIKGDAPLAMQCRPQAVVENLSRKDNGLPVIKYKNSDARRFIDSIHWISNNKPDTLNDNLTDEELMSEFQELLKNNEASFGIPTEAFKESICKGAYRNKVSKDIVSVRGSFIIMGEYAKLSFSGVQMEKVPTVNKNAKGAMVISVYSKFYDWETKLRIKYNENLISPESLVNMINLAGMSVGVLARRTELSFGKYGTFSATEVTKM